MPNGTLLGKKAISVGLNIKNINSYGNISNNDKRKDDAG